MEQCLIGRQEKRTTMKIGLTGLVRIEGNQWAVGAAISDERDGELTYHRSQVPMNAAATRKRAKMLTQGVAC